MASRGINKVILVGNLGNDPEVRYMPNGNAVANVSLATSDSWKDKATGECKGFAFVNFAKRKDARNCVMHYNEHPKNYLDGKHVVFEHAKAWEGNVEKKPAACSYGIECQKEDCYFSHPAGWAFEKKSTGGKGGGSKTGGSGGDGKGNSSAGGTRDGKVRKKVRSKGRLGAKARQRAKKRAAKEEAEKAG